MGASHSGEPNAVGLAVRWLRSHRSSSQNERLWNKGMVRAGEVGRFDDATRDIS